MGERYLYSLTGTEAFDLLVAEGFPYGEVAGALDALIARGLRLQQGDKGVLLTAAEVEALRATLGRRA